MDAFDIVSLGEPMIEFNQTGDGGGRLYLQGYGGDTSNFAIAAARQGARVGYVSALGDDLTARCCARLWDAEGVDHAGVRSRRRGLHGDLLRHPRRARPPLQLLSQRIGGQPHGAGRRAARAHCAAKVLHLSGISLAISSPACDAAYAAIETARAAGVKVSFDTNLRLKLWPLDRARAVMSDVHRVLRYLPAKPGRHDRHNRSDRCGRDRRPLPAAGREDGGTQAGCAGSAGRQTLAAASASRPSVPAGRRHRRWGHLWRRLRRPLDRRRRPRSRGPLRRRRRRALDRGLRRGRADSRRQAGTCSARCRTRMNLRADTSEEFGRGGVKRFHRLLSAATTPRCPRRSAQTRRRGTSCGASPSSAADSSAANTGVRLLKNAATAGPTVATPRPQQR